MNILQEVERHLKVSGEKPCQLGRRAARDPNLVHDLRRGRQPGPALTARLRAYIAQGSPIGTKAGA